MALAKSRQLTGCFIAVSFICIAKGWDLGTMPKKKTKKDTPAKPKPEDKPTCEKTSADDAQEASQIVPAPGPQLAPPTPAPLENSLSSDEAWHMPTPSFGLNQLGQQLYAYGVFKQHPTTTFFRAGTFY